MNKFSILVFTLFTLSISAQIDNEANFYTVVGNADYNLTLVSDNNFATDDSDDLQDDIDEIETNGGGVLTIPAGNYSFGNVNLKSNVHIEINENAVIRPFYEIPASGKLKNYAIFKLGSNTNPIENVSIINPSGLKFQVDLTHNINPNVAVVNCIKVTNFLVANFNVEDSYTKFSSVTMGGDFYNNVYAFPTNGIVKDFNINNAHYGYGTVQTQSAKNILFKNLSGTGGATLRLETGATALNDLQVVGEPRVGGLDEIVARNISNTNGNSAVMISPHAIHNGTVDVEGVTMVSSGFAVRVEGGFISNDYDQTIGLTDGTFESVRIKDVTATYGVIAELKTKHYKYYPPEITGSTTEASYLEAGEKRVYIGESVAAVLAETDYACTNGIQTVVIEAPIVANGFDYQEPVIPEEYVNLNCSTLGIGDSVEEGFFELFPNPTSEVLRIKSLRPLEAVIVFNASGGIMLNKIDKLGEFEGNIDVSNLSKGVYFVQVFVGRNFFTKKILIK
ncbi:T9SS type A sorting domain-containing protein [Lutibacter citreus]|uniref:T9SS type A sorting domain-containing protein n=1 Tax=Lutibacter citreus TaxID=2138210 RepID=UPI000DBE9A29|nr:T9SS type A sorting domain-containing protein [Lutibacter citreus]